MFGKRELFLTFDAAEMEDITRKLDDAKIRYEIRRHNFGKNRSQKIMYYIYVRSRDYDLARAVMNGNAPGL